MAKKLQGVGALWKREDSKGNEYYTGKLEDGTKLVAWPKKDGDKDNAPDIKIYVSEDRAPGSAKTGGDTPF